MATFHCSVKVGGLGKGAAHAAYIAREGKYEHLLHSEKAEKLEHLESGNMPAWAAHRPLEFWEQADQRERKNGAVYREFELALPNELSPAQAVALVREFVRQEIGDKHAYTWAIHNGRAAIDGQQNNRNAHVMFSERLRDGIERGPDIYFKRAAAPYRDRKTKELIQPDAAARAKGGLGKSDEWSGTKAERRETLVALRSRFADLTNTHLARHGHSDRVSHLSLKDQGVERAPEQHLGPKGARTPVLVETIKGYRAAEAEEAQARRLAAKVTFAADEAKADEKRRDWLKHLATRRQAWANKPGIVLTSAPAKDGKIRVHRWGADMGKAAGLAVVIDFGNYLKPAGRPENISDMKIQALLEVAEKKGWKEISVTGSAKFRQRVADAAAARGLGLHDADLKTYIASALRERQAQAAAEQERVNAQVAAQERVKAQMKEREAALNPPPSAPLPTAKPLPPPRHVPEPAMAARQRRADEQPAASPAPQPASPAPQPAPIVPTAAPVDYPAAQPLPVPAREPTPAQPAAQRSVEDLKAEKKALLLESANFAAAAADIARRLQATARPVRFHETDVWVRAHDDAAAEINANVIRQGFPKALPESRYEYDFQVGWARQLEIAKSAFTEHDNSLRPWIFGRAEWDQERTRLKESVELWRQRIAWRDEQLKDIADAKFAESWKAHKKAEAERPGLHEAALREKEQNQQRRKERDARIAEIDKMLPPRRQGKTKAAGNEHPNKHKHKQNGGMEPGGR